MKVLLLQVLLEWLALNVAPALDATAALGSPRFKVRQEASRALQRGWPATDATLRKTSLSSDVEASERARAVRRQCLERALEQAGPPPWADWPLMMPDAGGWDGRTWPWLDARIQRQLPPYQEGLPLFHQWRQLSEQWGRDALQAGLPPALLRIWFMIGRNVDAKWKLQHEQQPKQMPNW